MARRAEVGVATQQDPLEARLATPCDRLVEPLRRSLVRRPVATPVHQRERLPRVRQRHHQRVIPPPPVIGDPHPLLALAGRLRQRPVRLEDRLGQELRRLLLPHLPPYLIDRRQQRLDIGHREPPAEVARGGRVRDHLRPQRVQVHLVLAALLQILQRLPAAQDVVGDVQDVVRLVVGLMHLQQPHMVVDRRRQPGALRQQLHRPDAARPETADASTALVVEVPPTEHRLQLRPPVAPTQPPPNSLLAPCLPLLYC